VPHYILHIIFNSPVRLYILILTFASVILFPLDLSNSTVFQICSVELQATIQPRIAAGRMPMFVSAHSMSSHNDKIISTYSPHSVAQDCI
jgi:hypothetical protein